MNSLFMMKKHLKMSWHSIKIISDLGPLLKALMGLDTINFILQVWYSSFVQSHGG